MAFNVPVLNPLSWQKFASYYNEAFDLAPS